MKTIKEIKSIEITLEEDDVIKMDFNGCNEKEGYTLIIPKDNAVKVARALTRFFRRKPICFSNGMNPSI